MFPVLSPSSYAATTAVNSTHLEPSMPPKASMTLTRSRRNPQGYLPPSAQLQPPLAYGTMTAEETATGAADSAGAAAGGGGGMGSRIGRCGYQGRKWRRRRQRSLPWAAAKARGKPSWRRGSCRNFQPLPPALQAPRPSHSPQMQSSPSTATDASDSAGAVAADVGGAPGQGCRISRG